MEKKIKIAFVTASDPLDKKSWSGIYYQMYKSLESKTEKVDCIGPIPLFFIKSLAVINKLTRILFNKGYNHKNSILLSFIHSKFIQFKLRNKDYDYIFAPAASTEVAFLNTDIPIIYCSDSSFGQLNGYYDTYSNLFKFSVRESDFIEQKAILKASSLVYSSDWAKDFVEKNYKRKGDAVTIAFGANVNDAIKVFPKKIGNAQTVELLFLGVNWERKGGDLVYSTFIKLIESNYDVNLTVCGCIPPVKHPRMKVIPFLDKNNPQDAEKFTAIFQNSHFLFLPTLADCTPIVFCESSFFATPIITRDTGGVSEIVKNGINGYCLDGNAGVDDYFNVFQRLIENGKEYEELSLSSRKLYEDRLNWDKWANELLDLTSNG